MKQPYISIWIIWKIGINDKCNLNLMINDKWQFGMNDTNDFR